MPGISAGKRSVKQLVSRQYDGKSASQQVKAAQWTGQLDWNDADHPSQEKKTAGYGCSAAPCWKSNVDYNKPWFERKNDDFYCNLCGAWATDGHVASEKHVWRAQNPEYYGFGERSLPEHLKHEWFTDKGNGEYYCELCKCMATDAHCASDRHRNREEHPEYYWQPARQEPPSQAQPLLPEPWQQVFSEEHQEYYYFNTITNVTTWDLPQPAPSTRSHHVPSPAAPSQLPTPPMYDFPWFELREGDWYCNLCTSWATDSHIVGQKHVKRAAWPSYYGFPSQQNASNAASATPTTEQPSQMNAPGTYISESSPPPPYSIGTREITDC